MEQHLVRIESLLIQIEYELLEIKRVLGLPSSQENLLRHLYELRQSALAAQYESDIEDEPDYRPHTCSDGEDEIDCSTADRK